MMRRTVWMVAFLVALVAGAAGRAQDAWVQIEARPSLAEAEERARAYAGAFPNVQGYRLTSGWYGILLGPFTADEAARQLQLLTSERMIPADSYIADGGNFTRRFWPAGVATGLPQPATTPEAPTLPETALPEPPAPIDETPEEARISESLLTPDERLDIQRAMQATGVYEGKIDGSFGRGTRAAMAAWQERNGHAPTGILTSGQRRALVDAWQAERAAVGLTPVSEAEAGIDIDLPLGLVEFKGYEPPFVRYDTKDGSGYQVLLISRRGDGRTLAALYDRLQALELMPVTGERVLGRASFTVAGADETKAAHAQAALAGGMVKGFVLVWPPADGARAAKVLDAMKATFAPRGERALDENLGEPSQVSSAALAEGLEVRRPVLSRSGVFVDWAGTVLTTAEVVEGCGSLTIDGRHPADLAFRDDRLGIAVLRPREPLAPRAVADLAAAPPRAEAEVALAGHSYPDRLSAPVVTFGTFVEDRGLNGEPELAQLAMATLPGDAGGAVLYASGAMAGMLLPRAAPDGRELPKGVSFAVDAAAVAAALSAQGVVMEPSPRTGSLAPEDLAERARAMTVLVSCWK